MTSAETFSFHLKGQTCVHIDWANVYGWDQGISAHRLAAYLQSYPQITAVHFYYGLDQHPKSHAFLEKIKKIGFTLHTKPVKYIKVSKNPLVLKRKCDFDIEITIEVLFQLNQYKSFIFFSGDGDFEPLYQQLIARGKQVIIIFAKGYLGKEIVEMRGRIFLLDIKRLKSLL